MTITSGQTQGWSFSLKHGSNFPSGNVSISGVTTTGTQTATVQNGSPPDTNETQFGAGFAGYTQGVLIDTSQLITLAPTTNFVTSKACYAITAPSTSGTYQVTLSFTHDIGTPSIRSVVAQLGQSIVPCAKNFTFNVYVSPSVNQTVGGCGFSYSGPQGSPPGGQGPAGPQGGEGDLCKVMFKRGDCDASNATNITDAVFLLAHLFTSGPEPSCLDACDANTDEHLDITDAIYLLGYLFLGTYPAPLVPFTECGISTSPLTCNSFSPCPATSPNLTAEAGDQSETAVAINPEDPNHIVIVANRWTANGFFRAFTTDGGLTWIKGHILLEAAPPAPPAPPEPPEPPEQTGPALDPGVAIDKFGNVFLVYLRQGLRVAVSTDGGLTFPADVATRRFLSTGGDRPVVATGPTTIAEQSSVWVVSRRVPSPHGISAFGLAVSGPITTLAAFNEYEVTECENASPIPESDRDCDTNYADVAVGPLGELMIAYNNGAHPLEVTRPVTVFVKFRASAPPSQNQAFETKLTITSNVCGLVGGDFGFDYIPARPPGAKGILAEPELAWDLERTRRVYLTFTQKGSLDVEGNENHDTDVMFLFADPPYTAWEPNIGGVLTPKRVNDDPVLPVNSQFFQCIAVDQTNGDVALAWYDTRPLDGEPQDLKLVRCYVTYSSDGGDTFKKNSPISCERSNGDPAPGTDQSTLGDYIGIDFSNQFFFPVWGDNSGGDTEVFTKKVAAP